VIITCNFSGHFHVEKLTCVWKYDGPSSYEVLISTTGSEWMPVITRDNMPPRVTEEVEVGQAGRAIPCRYLRITLLKKNHAKYLGLQELRIQVLKYSKSY